MLPGVEVARRRRIHSHHNHHHETNSRRPLEPASAGVQRELSFLGPSAIDGSTLAARLRLEEKLRGLYGAPAGASFFFSSRNRRHVEDVGERSRAPTIAPRVTSATVTTMIPTKPRGNAVLKRSVSRTDVCAVCLDEVQANQRVTKLPCSHKYHSDCVLPWLAAHSHCPCCRTNVPSLDSLL